MPDVPVVEVQSAGAEDLRGEVELLPPVGDDLAPEEPRRPGVHLSGNLLGDLEEDRVAVDGQFQVALVVERHRRDLAERILAVEHPAVGAREQRVGDVAQSRFDRRARPGGRAGALNPLPAKIAGDLAADELAVPGVLHCDLRARDDRLRIEERHAAVDRARAPHAGRCAPVITALRSASSGASAASAESASGVKTSG